MKENVLEDSNIVPKMIRKLSIGKHICVHQIFHVQLRCPIFVCLLKMSSKYRKKTGLEF